MTRSLSTIGVLKYQVGVCFVVSDKFLSKLKRFKTINNRICYLELSCNWHNLFIINGYAPTEDKNEAIKNDFYERLDIECNLLSSNKVKILIGDFVTKVGQEPLFSPTIKSNNLHIISNDNSTRPMNFATSTRNGNKKHFLFPYRNTHDKVGFARRKNEKPDIM